MAERADALAVVMREFFVAGHPILATSMTTRHRAASRFTSSCIPGRPRVGFAGSRLVELLRVWIHAALVACVLMTCVHAQVPSNNNCAGAITVVDGVNGPFTSVNATTSAPAWQCFNVANDVWFRYVAGAGVLTVSTCGLASWDTAIEILGDCTSTSSIACNDNGCGLFSLQSSVTVQVTPGTYYIRVGGYGGAWGPFSLSVQGSVPSNNNCLGAITVVNGVNGPFGSVNATTSAPAWQCPNVANDVWFRYVAGAGVLTVETCNLAIWDTVIEILGDCTSTSSIACNDDACGLQSRISVPVTPGTYYIRVGGYGGASGVFNLLVQGPPGTLASAVSYGLACGDASRAFYESFLPWNPIDLSYSSMRLVKTGNFYVAQVGAPYVAPSSAATTLPLGNDAEVPVVLTGSFPYIGGTTSTLHVCSNGFVSAWPGNPTGPSIGSAQWLASMQPRWGCWHDFNPAAPGSGAVKFEQIGTIAYVTWDGVFSSGHTYSNTWQLQFDLATGDVTYAWQGLVPVNGPNQWIVGYAAAAPNNDLGSLDISAALPATFRTSADNASNLVLSGSLPRLATTCVLTTSGFPPTSPLGVQVLSPTVVNPGLNLTGLGLPGCYQHVWLDVSIPLGPSAGQIAYPLAIPGNVALIGVHVFAQSVGVVYGVNPWGLVTSNGLDLTIGL